MTCTPSKEAFTREKEITLSTAAKSNKIRTWNWPSDLAMWRSLLIWTRGISMKNLV